MRILVLVALVNSALCVRINFTSCHHAEWSCVNNVPNEIVFTCSTVRSNDFVIHLKDFYTDHIVSVTIQNCRDLRVVLDCPLLQRASRLNQFKIKDCDRLEFITLSATSSLQTPSEVTIENVREVVSFPRNIFKSPTTSTELKCSGTLPLTNLRVVNSKINSITTKAISNTNGMKTILFQNVTITDIQTQGFEAVMASENSMFTMTNSKVDNLEFKGINIQATTVKLSSNTFNEIRANGINVTADNFFLTGNTFKEIHSNGIVVNAPNIDIVNNNIALLKSNALQGIRCMKKRVTKKQINFSKNNIERIEPYSLFFNHGSCKLSSAQVIFRENKIDCKCRNIAFLNTPSISELSGLILNTANNNTCFLAPCILPIDIVKLLQESDMCHLNLDPKVMCLLYYDKHSNNTNIDVNTDEDVTEPAPTFYLIRQANSLAGDASAAMTAIDKDDLLRDSHMNMTNRTTVKVVFDSSKDFVETLRSTGRSRSRQEATKSPPREEYINRCVGSHCRSNAYDKQKALDFYKYVYAQLRTPRENDNKKNKI